MSFWQSPLIKRIEQGELPTVTVDANITIDDESLLQIGVVLMVSMVAAVVVYKLITDKG
jgi:hypothetical protein